MTSEYCGSCGMPEQECCGVQSKATRVRLETEAKRLSTYQDLLDNMQFLRDSKGAVIVFASGDELELSQGAIDNYLSNYAERCQEAADEAYYGGDSPGSYGPDDKRGC